MQIIVDTRQKDGKHDYKHHQMERAGHTLVFQKLDHGDYMRPAGRVSIDTKQNNLNEIWSNLKGSHKVKDTSKAKGYKCVRNYDRMREEFKRADKANHVLVVLIENRLGIRNLKELSEYKENDRQFNRRKFARQKIDGVSLAKQMKTISTEYGVLWAFCHPAQTGKKIVEYLSREEELLEHKKKVKQTNEWNA